MPVEYPCGEAGGQHLPRAGSLTSRGWASAAGQRRQAHPSWPASALLPGGRALPPFLCSQGGAPAWQFQGPGSCSRAKRGSSGRVQALGAPAPSSVARRGAQSSVQGGLSRPTPVSVSRGFGEGGQGPGVRQRTTQLSLSGGAQGRELAERPSPP